jgi:hypothetical protein
VATQFDEISDFDSRPVCIHAVPRACSIQFRPSLLPPLPLLSLPLPRPQTSYPTSNNDAFGEIMSNLENQKAPPAPVAGGGGGAAAAPAAAAPGSHLKSAPLFELMEKVRGWVLMCWMGVGDRPVVTLNGHLDSAVKDTRITQPYDAKTGAQGGGRGAVQEDQRLLPLHHRRLRLGARPQGRCVCRCGWLWVVDHHSLAHPTTMFTIRLVLFEQGANPTLRAGDNDSAVGCTLTVRSKRSACVGLMRLPPSFNP